MGERLFTFHAVVAMSSKVSQGKQLQVHPRAMEEAAVLLRVHCTTSSPDSTGTSGQPGPIKCADWDTRPYVALCVMGDCKRLVPKGVTYSKPVDHSVNQLKFS